MSASRSSAIAESLEQAHFPVSFDGRDAALRRVAFDELLALQLGMVGRRRQRGRDSARPVDVDDATDAGLRAGLEGSIGRKLDRDVRLTDDQDAAISEIRSDLGRATPMLRLLQGDVGSGKTAVAAYALGAAARAGLQGALLAPTDLLARQHHRTLTALLEDAAIPVELLTGSLTAGSARRTLELVASGMAPVVVGTHALLQERVAFASLGVVVIDEQHRFGVEQRGQLEAKAGGDRAPHVLLMTATPDPADPRPGALCGPRRLEPADAAGGPAPDPDRHPPARGARRDVAEGPRGGGRRASDVRGGPADRRGGRGRRASATAPPPADSGTRRPPPRRPRPFGCGTSWRRSGSAWSTAG